MNRLVLLSNGLESLEPDVVTGLTVAFFVVVGLTLAYLIVSIARAPKKKKNAEKRPEVKSFRLAETRSFHLADSGEHGEARSETAAETDERELIAVISAAIAAFTQADGKRREIKSVVRKPARGGWGNAGVWENVTGNRR
ncbi:MAG: OadG family protein [Oscillospiraceae bacterium]|jgi:hypothetical protein|nr:OadG family protein [Oscillospiraceae bacterium]